MTTIRAAGLVEQKKRRSKRPSKRILGIIIIIVLMLGSMQLWIGHLKKITIRVDDDESRKRESQVLENALIRIKARNAYLYPGNTDKSQWGWKTGGPKRFQKVKAVQSQVMNLALQPYYACPWSLHRTNFVSETIPEPHFDGGKWTCGLEEMRQRRCIVYSFGSNGDDFFESDVSKQNPSCEIHIFDPTSGEPPSSWKNKYHFHRTGLCVGNATTFTLEGTNTHTKGEAQSHYPCQSISSHMNRLGHTHVDILKVDVEGMEWELFTATGFNGILSNIGQLLIEFHFWHPSSPQHLSELLRSHIIPLERMGYFLSTSEPVGAEIDSYEVTFLNVNWSPQTAFQSSTKLFDNSMYPTTPNIIL